MKKLLKKCTCFLLTAAILTCTITYIPVSAAISTNNSLITEETVEYLPNGDTCTITTEIQSNTGISLCSGQTVSKTKTYAIKNSADKLMAKYVLKGTFTYGTGNPAVCTNASCTTWTQNTKYKFTATAAYTENNKAIGTFTLKYPMGIQTKTLKKTLTLSCTVNGVVS